MRHYEYTPRLFAAIAVMVLVAALGSSDSLAGPAAEDTMSSLVTTEWLSQHLDDPDLVVLDCSVHIEMEEGGGLQVSIGRADYDAGHIPSITDRRQCVQDCRTAGGDGPEITGGG